MEGRSQIRWNDTDKKELRRVIKNFNAKLSRIEKKDPDLMKYMPNKVKIGEIEAKIETRGDLKRQINSLKRFTERGAEKLKPSDTMNKVTEWEYNEYAIKNRANNIYKALKRKHIEALERKSRGRNIGYNVGMMGSEEMNAYKPRQMRYEKLSKHEWQKMKDMIDKMYSREYRHGRDERLRENYLKGLDNALGSGIFQKDIDRLKQWIEGLPIQQFLDVFYSDMEGDLYYVYDHSDMAAKVENLKAVWGLSGVEKDNTSDNAVKNRLEYEARRDEHKKAYDHERYNKKQNVNKK